MAVVAVNARTGERSRRELTDEEEDRRVLDRQRAQEEMEQEKKRQQQREQARQVIRDFASRDDELAKALRVLLLDEGLGDS